MITTNSDDLAEKLRLYRSQGMDQKTRYWFPVVGYNYRMTNIQAAIGLAQLEQLQKFLEIRRVIKDLYSQKLAHLGDFLHLPESAPWAEPTCWLYTVFLKFGNKKHRDQIVEDLNNLGIETRPAFIPMHNLPPYYSEEKFPIVDQWSQRGINLPTHIELTDEHITRISGALSNLVMKYCE